MYKLLILLLGSLVLMCSKDPVAGTVTDTNSGSITGLVLNKNEIYKDSVAVTLFTNDTIIKKITSSMGQYRFDSLQAGTYTIGVFKDSILIGKEPIVTLGANEQKTINIQVIIIINQVFQITTINKTENITINNFYINGATGDLDTLGNGKFKLSFAEKDTVFLRMGIIVSGKTDSLLVTFVKNIDGTYSSLPVNPDISLLITDGVTIRNTGNGSDSSIVKITGEIQEEGL
jgi:hypothetical protein